MRLIGALASAAWCGGLVPALAFAAPPPAAEAGLPERVETANRLMAERLHAEAEPVVAAILRDIEAGEGPDGETALAWAGVLGQIRLELGRHAEAEPLLLRVWEARRRQLGEDHADTALAQNGLAAAYQRQGRYEEASRLYRSALAVLERKLGADDQRTLLVANNLAGAYLNLGRYAAAEPLSLRVVAASARVLGEEHPDTLHARQDLARLRELQGRLHEAEEIAARVLAARERSLGPEHPNTLTSVNNLGNVHVQLGRYAEAEASFARALETRARLLGPDHPLTLVSVNNLAMLYDRQERHAEAEPLLVRALRGREDALGADHPETLLAANNLALSYQRQGRHEEAEPLFRRALTGVEERLGSDHPDVLVPLHNLAGNHEDRRLYGEAERLYRRSLEASERRLGAEHPTTLRFAYNLAGLYVTQEQREPAEALLRRVLDTGERVLGGTNPLVLAAGRKLVTLRLSSAGERTDALAPARQLVSRVRARRIVDAGGAFAAVQQEREEAVQGTDFSLLAESAWRTAAADPGQSEALRAEAFAALQDAMAGPAARSIARMAVRRYAERAGAGLEDLARERELLIDRWSANAVQLSSSLVGDGEAAELRAALRSESEAIDRRLAEIDSALRSGFPDYFSLIRPEPISLAAAQALLDADEALLIVVPNAMGTQLMLVTREGAAWRRSGWNAERIDAAVQRLRWDLGARVTAPEETISRWRAEFREDEAPGFDRRTAFAVHQELVAPFAGTVAGKRRLYVAAAGPAAGLPFSVLVTRPPEGADNDAAALRATAWLGDEIGLAHIPSVQSLALLRQAGREAPRSGDGALAGFGDPVLLGVQPSRRGVRGAAVPDAQAVLSGSLSRAGTVLADVDRLRRLTRLPGTARELENLRRAFGAPQAAIHLREEATETLVRSADLSTARILAFATHGLTGGELRSLVEPGLVLTPPAVASERDDGYLAASEVATLRLDADWVILSACNTATGEDSRGLSALARAFFYAGARRLLASHWPVDDEVASRITVRTVELTRDGRSRAEAFQAAAREIRLETAYDTAVSSWAHPYYWAPFVLIGDGR
ncbi:CHAT domain-containing protein [Sphingosinicella terrae]|uniref:CHAT domain-containing protein n=1 Tax=Sphingosinicella terrae TaxID=2172047 RepID=UPI0013B3CC6F|nr:CHAT domain-containing tetratricopeptide repeat protein [Sphingosinicella terrae]